VSTETIMPPEAPKPLPKREEVPVELTWDLSVVYEKDELWESDFKRVEEMSEPAARITGQAEQCLEPAARLADAGRSRHSVSQLYSYASLKAQRRQRQPGCAGAR
jgi:oligoendopeptidase F